MSTPGFGKRDHCPFRLVKALERTGIRRADQIVVLTERLRDWMIANELKPANQIQVIPCCVDFGRFRDAAAPETSNSNKFEVVYAGSLLGLYLVEEMGRFFKALKGLRPMLFCASFLYPHQVTAQRHCSVPDSTRMILKSPRRHPIKCRPIWNRRTWESPFAKQRSRRSLLRQLRSLSIWRRDYR